MDLTFEIINQRLELTNNELDIVNQSHNYLNVLLNFNTEDWTDKVKFVLFKNKQRKAYLFNYTDEGVKIPSTVLTGNNFRIMVYGVNNDEERITTNELLIKLNKSGFTTEISSINDEEIIDVFADIELKLSSKLSREDIDTELNANSDNPVANRVITNTISTMDDNIDERSDRRIINAMDILRNFIRS